MPRDSSLASFVERARARWGLVAAVAVIALVPVVRAIGLVRSSSKLQYGDYWPMLDRMLSDGGSWSFRGIVSPRNEHPIAIPKALYALNAEVFGGSNHTLGYLVVGIVISQVVLIGWLALRTDRYGRWSVAALTVASSFLLFAPQGAWNFVKAMSGTAWLSTNLLVLAALVAQRADRRFLTPVLGLLATASYGTGLAVWPALGLVALLQHRRSALREWPTFVAGGVAMTSYLVWYSSRPSNPFARPSLLEQAENTLELIGSALAEGGAATALGLVAVIGIVACSALLWRERTVLPWIGLGGYGLAVCALVNLGRYSPTAVFDESRYASLSALTWLALLALVLAVLPKRWWVVLVPAPLIVAAFVGGQSSVEAEKRVRPAQELRAIALRIGVSDDAPGPFAEPFPAITDRLDQTGHYPFNDDFTADCGQFGQQVSVADDPASEAPGTMVAELEDHPYPGARYLTGRVETDRFDVDCVVVLDDNDSVIGVGTLAPAPLGNGSTVASLAPEGEVHRVFVRLSGDEEFVPLDDPEGLGG